MSPLTPPSPGAAGALPSACSASWSGPHEGLKRVVSLADTLAKWGMSGGVPGNLPDAKDVIHDSRDVSHEVDAVSPSASDARVAAQRIADWCVAQPAQTALKRRLRLRPLRGVS